ncbi:MAG: glutamate racemase [Erysipelotrichaceae bacterium]|nr:glutamate racemase [Erysipelotrichaceae bacterium]
MNKKYIGIFDSGLGGLTTTKAIIEKLPNENIVFFADKKNLPYGDKTKEELISCSFGNLEFLEQYDLKALVIACNTVDSNVRDKVEEKAKEKVFGVIEPAARKAALLTKNNKIGLLATEMAVKSKTYEKKVHKYNENALVYQVACPLLVPMIEKGSIVNEPEEMCKVFFSYMKPLMDEGIDTLILGCTHYDLLIPLCEKEYPDLNIVSSSREVVSDIEEYLKNEQHEENEVSRLYFVNTDPENFVLQARSIISDITIKKAGGSD